VNASALERYLSHLRHERRLAGHTLKAYERDAHALLELAAGRPLESIGTHEVRRFVATLHSKGQSPRSLARALSCWRGLYDWLVRERLAAANPCEGVKPPRAARRLPEALSPDDAVRLVTFEADTPEGKRDRALFELAYS